MICEHCKNSHDGNYGSGRFCSSKCARSFSTSENRQEINKKISNSLKRHKCVKGGLIRLCNYGCGKKANYKLKNGKWCCENSHNKCNAIKSKNSKGVKLALYNGKGRQFNKEDSKKGVEVRKKKLQVYYDSLPFEQKPLVEKSRLV